MDKKEELELCMNTLTELFDRTGYVYVCITVTRLFTLEDIIQKYNFPKNMCSMTIKHKYFNNNLDDKIEDGDKYTLKFKFEDLETMYQKIDKQTAYNYIFESMKLSPFNMYVWQKYDEPIKLFNGQFYTICRNENSVVIKSNDVDSIVQSIFNAHKEKMYKLNNPPGGNNLD